MNPMVPGLQGGKMSASDPDSKIDVLDTPEVVKKKLKKAFAPPKQIEENGILSFVEYVLLPAGELRFGTPKFVVERREGEPLVYTSIAQMHKDYMEDIVSLHVPAARPQMLTRSTAHTADPQACRDRSPHPAACPRPGRIPSQRNVEND